MSLIPEHGNKGHIEHCYDGSTRASTRAPNSAAATGGSVHEGNIKIVPWLVLMALFSGFSMAFSIAAIGAVWVLYTKFHVLTVTVDNHDALMLRWGVKEPGDVAKGPNGNLEYQPRK